MQANIKRFGLSVDHLTAVRSELDGEDRHILRESQRDLCEVAGSRIAELVQEQLAACDMRSARDWLRHRATVIGYVYAMSENAMLLGSSVPRWGWALTCLTALTSLFGSECSEDALCSEGQRLWQQGHPGYFAGVQAAGMDRSAIEGGKLPGALTRLVLDRETRNG